MPNTVFCDFNPFYPEFLKQTLPFLNSDTSIVANRGLSEKSMMMMANSVDHDETARDEPCHLDLHSKQRYLQR